jgi:hypothetical protein
MVAFLDKERLDFQVCFMRLYATRLLLLVVSYFFEWKLNLVFIYILIASIHYLNDVGEG